MSEPSQPKPAMRMADKVVLRIGAKALIPFILLFGLYVQFHGDFGPGGGFQAGVIIAAGFILYALIFGLDDMHRVAPPGLMEKGMALGVLLYGGTGVLNMALGGNFLEYGTLDPHHPAHGQHYGILLVEAGVGLCVACTMLTLYTQFANRGRR
jgi:multicomponent Na+:H+ antiporter subunit B